MMPSAVTQRGDEILARLSLARLCQGPVKVVEVGVWDGRLSQFLLRQRPDLSLVMVDTWRAPAPASRYHRSGSQMALRPQPEFDAAYFLAMKRTAFAGDRTTVWRGRSVEQAENVADASCDLVFVDADHSFDAVLEDIAAWWPKVADSGWIGGHDWQHPRHEGVTRAVKGFFGTLTGRWVVETGKNRTWFVRKR